MSILPASSIGDESTGFFNDVIDQSLKFNDGSSSYLEDTASGTPSSTTNRAISLWVKRTHLSTTQMLMTGHVSGPNVSDFINFRSDDTIMIYVDVSAGGSDETYWQTTAKFRDTTNWYHIFVKYTLSESSNADKVKLYVNGNLTSLTATQTGSAVTSSRLLSNGTTYNISKYYNSAYYLDGYLAEYNVIDGDADQTDFGETKNGVWIPKAYTGSYGNSGFRLTFEATGTGTTADGTDNSSNMTNLGDDKSGNANNFAVYNLGSQDKVLDTPENNWCILNNLTAGDVNDMSEGGLQYADNRTGGTGNAIGTFALSSGKWYWEVHYDYDPGASNMVGIVAVDEITGSHLATDAIIGYGEFFGWDERGIYYVNGGSSSGKTSYVAGDIISFALDVDAGKLFIRKNDGSFEDSGDPVNGTNPSHTFTAGTLISPMVQNYRSSRHVFNFGQDPTFNGDGSITAGTETDSGGVGLFKYAPPTGYLAICAKNLPNVGIAPDQSTQAGDHFNTITWNGTGASANAKTGVGFQPDWLWAKDTDYDNGHILLDSVRGVTKYLQSAASTGDTTDSNILQSFDADGFTTVGQGINFSSGGVSPLYVGWNWKAGGAPSADNSAGAGNTPTANSVKIDGSNLGSALAGTIPATRLSANTTAGFSIVTYTGTGTQSDTVAHGLGKKPDWYFTKSRSEAQNWHVYHDGLDTSAPEDYTIFLNASNARATSSANYWNSTAPTTSVVSVGDDNSSNKDGVTYVMYCFATIEGYSKFGRYTGNSSTNGTFVYTGFRPAYIIIKGTSSANWYIYDKARNPNNVVDLELNTNTLQKEATFTTLDFLSNGFKLRTTNDAFNVNTYIYMAFADQPFKFSNAR